MSLETDARDALIEAIREINNVELDPDAFDNVKASDNTIGAKDGTAWRKTLSYAAELLRTQGYEVEEPSLDKATALRTQVLLESSIYLEILCGAPSDNALAKAAAAAAVAGAITFVAVRFAAKAPKRRKAPRSRSRRS